jgi:hypothetical protein
MLALVTLALVTLGLVTPALASSASTLACRDGIASRRTSLMQPA